MKENTPILHLSDYADDLILIGAYREDKAQLAWIHDKKLYNIRHNVDLLESREGGVLAPKLPKFIIIYSWERPTEYEVYASIRVSEKKESTMKKMGYPDPQGAYFLYDLGTQYDLPSLDLAAFLIAYKQSHQDFVDAAPILVNGNDLKAYAGEDEKWFGLNDLLPKVPAQKKKSSHKPQESRESVIQKMLTSADVKEDYIERLGTGEEYESILELLLRDQSKGERTELIPQPGGKSYKHYHIIWATDDYKRRGEGYGLTDEILPRLITRKNNRIIRPRAVKSKEEQQRRIKQKAEVFTPSWVCNAQNNLVDEAWFGRKDVFNHENDDHTWTTNYEPIQFSEEKGRTWRDYINERRLEICCGEAPYIVSRYDTTTGELIPLRDRIGLLDRKLRVAGEHAEDLRQWREYAYKSIRSVYGFEWQGDNLLLARENILVSYLEYYYDFCQRKGFTEKADTSSLAHVAFIISWNLWQMDGIRYIVPYSDAEISSGPSTLAFEEQPEQISKPQAIYAKIARWVGKGREKYRKETEFRNLVNTK